MGSFQGISGAAVRIEANAVGRFEITKELTDEYFNRVALLGPAACRAKKNRPVAGRNATKCDEIAKGVGQYFLDTNELQDIKPRGCRTGPMAHLLFQGICAAWVRIEANAAGSCAITKEQASGVRNSMALLAVGPAHPVHGREN